MSRSMEYNSKRFLFLTTLFLFIYPALAEAQPADMIFAAAAVMARAKKAIQDDYWGLIY